MKIPCKGCAERQINCHAKCDKYISFKKWNDDMRDREREHLELISFICDSRRTVRSLAKNTRFHVNQGNKKQP